MSTSAPLDDVLDCLVIGAGPAGLTAATYLARYRRKVMVIDGGSSRARWIPASHNCPGFPFGVAGNDLLQRFRAQADEFAVPIVPTRIDTLTREGGDFVAGDSRHSWRARQVILATGVVDRLPEINDVEQAIASGVLRLCAVCDGYEARDEVIGVLGPGDVVMGHAEFLRTFSRQVTALDSQAGDAPAEALRQRADAGGIVLRGAPVRLTLRDGACHATFADGSCERFDTLYPVLGADAQSALARALHAGVDESGELRVDSSMQTSVAGLYAIGDVVSGLNQISVAVGHAALAATAVHRQLPPNKR
ncbi:NAD(P)/FAD-dependent oxidoreductase [Rhodanobacter sp. T12-5]|uniref:NAD(P)/FAD-dependent oxidoreductase n=1 Tax=Rhodanobacter sp. T12-5 TaxID=2024611 RepID=UPI001F5BC826|nr:NAD(P)/FAD-dependent oxidoreductase [Rhodanobacter sp. T12-5]